MEGTWAPCFFSHHFSALHLSLHLFLSLLTRHAITPSISPLPILMSHPSLLFSVTEVEAAMMKTTTMTGLEVVDPSPPPSGGADLLSSASVGAMRRERWQWSSRVADRAPHPSGGWIHHLGLGRGDDSASNDGEPRVGGSGTAALGGADSPPLDPEAKRLAPKSRGWEARVSAEFCFWFYLPKIFLVDGLSTHMRNPIFADTGTPRPPARSENWFWLYGKIVFSSVSKRILWRRLPSSEGAHPYHPQGSSKGNFKSTYWDVPSFHYKIWYL